MQVLKHWLGHMPCGHAALPDTLPQWGLGEQHLLRVLCMLCILQRVLCLLCMLRVLCCKLCWAVSGNGKGLHGSFPEGCR